jgi:hypothetical protein
MERRDFIKSTALAAIAPSLCLQSCGSDSPLPIIDTHQHLWDLEMMQLTWVSPPLDRDFLMDDYLEAIAGQNVVKAIYMEVGAPPEKRKLRPSGHSACARIRIIQRWPLSSLLILRMLDLKNTWNRLKEMNI